MLDEKKLKSLLLNKYGYSEELGNQTIEDINNVDEDILQAINKWINDEEIINIVVEPCNVVSLIEAYNMNPIAAFIFIDWLRKEPNKALQCLGLGFDEVMEIEDIGEIL